MTLHDHPKHNLWLNSKEISIQLRAVIQSARQGILPVNPPCSSIHTIPLHFSPSRFISFSISYTRFQSIFSVHLRLPKSLDSLGDANIVGLELVQSNADGQGSDVEQPAEEGSQTGVSAIGDVVNDDLLETGVGVEEENAGEDGVGGRVERAGGEGGDGKRDKTSGDETLKGPVVGTVGGVGLGDGSRIVDTALNVLRSRRENGRSSGGVVESSDSHHLSTEDGLDHGGTSRDRGGSRPSRSQSGLPKHRRTHN